MTKLGKHIPKATDPNLFIPVEIQLPNKPDSRRRTAAYLRYNAHPAEIAAVLTFEGFRVDALMDAKIVRSKKDGDHWRIVVAEGAKL